MRAVIIIILGIILLAHPWNMKSNRLEHALANIRVAEIPLPKLIQNQAA